MKSRIEEIRSIIITEKHKVELPIVGNDMGISFDEVKQMFRDSIDESANINDLLQSVANKIYQKGLNDGIHGMKKGKKHEILQSI